MITRWCYFLNAVMLTRWRYCFSVAMIARWHYYINAVMATRRWYCLSDAMITRWRHCLNEVMITRWQYFLRGRGAVLCSLHWILFFASVLSRPFQFCVSPIMCNLFHLPLWCVLCFILSALSVSASLRLLRAG